MTRIVNRILLAAVCLTQGSLQSDILLSVSNDIVPENTTVTLTCSKKTGMLLESRWLNSMIPDQQAACAIVDDKCRMSNFLVNSNLYECICNGNGTYSVLLKNVTRRQNNAIWRCGVLSNLSNTVIIKVSVPLESVILRQSGYRTMYENSSTTLSCNTTYGLPPAMIRWYRYKSYTVEIVNSTDTTVYIKREYYTRGDNLVSTEDTLTYRVNRSVHGWNVYCNATNWNTDSVMSNKISLNITYSSDRPPVIHDFTNGSTYKVIESKLASLSCSMEGGNPLGKPKWLCENIINISSTEISTDNVKVTTNISWIATRNNGKTCICQSHHVLTNDFVFVNIDVLYPPEVPTIQLQFQHDKKTVTAVTKLIENKSYRFYCIADGNPPPTKYYWNGPQNRTKSNNGTLDFQNVQRKQNGSYSCHASNTMRPTYGRGYAVENSISVEIDILYKPAIAKLNNLDVAEGGSLNVTCEAVLANPNKTVIIWTRDKHDWNIMSHVLILRNISRSDSMNYTCTMKNKMIPTVGPVEEEVTSETFHLNVWYKASVKRFLLNGDKNGNLAVANESSSITIICEIDSNPSSTVNITLADGMEVTYADTNIIEYRHFLSSCHDLGVYTCSGSNYYNKGQPGSANLSLLVNCKPIAYSRIEEDIRSALYVPVNLQFTAVAYPKPEFTWEMRTHLAWTRITNTSMFHISSSGMQSNLTVSNFTSTEASHFRLIIENFVGKMIQNYTLQPFDRPIQPTEFSPTQELLTDTSVTLSWKPGYNGGTPQNFSIKYTSENDQKWEVIILQDTGEATMNVTIRGLYSSTYYEFQIVATNIKGSSETVTLIIQTKELSKRLEVNSASVVGIVIGSVVAVLGITIATVLTILIYRRYLKKKKERSSFVRSIAEVSEMTTIVGRDTACRNKKVYEEIRPEKERGTAERMENTYETLKPNKGRETSGKTENDFKEWDAGTDDFGSSGPVYTNLTIQCSKNGNKKYAH